MLTRSRTAIFLLKICILFSLLGFSAAQAQTGIVRVTATATTGPDQIALHWPADATATAYAVTRTNQGAALITGVPITVSGAASTSTGVTDPSAVVGQVYEYTVTKTTPGPTTSIGYVASGINVPLPGSNTGQRGTVVLVVANDAFADVRIVARINRLIQDLNGDGWKVVFHNVARDPGINTAGIDIDHGKSITDLKALIRADYNADPNVKAVFLFGHVPVPYSGDIAPDGVAGTTHHGAWPADVYYGDMGAESNWTDTTVNDTAADDPRNWNVPGDGKFDQNVAPGAVQLEVGRVDLANMTSFSAKSEFDLLTQYLDKDHNYRQGYTVALPVGRIGDYGFGGALTAYRNFSGFFGIPAVTTSTTNALIVDLSTGSFLWSAGYEANGNYTYSYNLAPFIGATSTFVDNDPHSMFYMLNGYYFGDWDHSDDFLRAPLATTTYGLTSVWAGTSPDWHFEDMGVGAEIGYSTLLTQNIYNTAPIGIYSALMGDPTLREHMVPPASNLSAKANNGDVDLTWAASLIGTQTALTNPVIGYNIYRQINNTGDFVPLASVSGSSTVTYTDTGAAGQTATYQVRAVTLYTSLTGTYYNQSQGAFATYDATHTAPTIVLVSPVKDTITETNATTGAPGASYVASAAAPVTVTIAAQVTSATGATVVFYQNSVAIGAPVSVAPYQTTVTLKPGDYVFSAVVTDSSGATAYSNLEPVNVYDSGADLNIYSGTLGNGWVDTSVKTINGVTQMSDSFGVANPNADNRITGNVVSVTLTTDNSSFVLQHSPIDASRLPHASLDFYINGGTTGGQNLTLHTPLQDSIGDTTLFPTANTWQHINVNLSGLAAKGDKVRNLDGLRIFTNNPGPVPTFYIADVQIVYPTVRGNRDPGVSIHLDTSPARYTVAQIGAPNGQRITATGDAATPDGIITEVDLNVDGTYYDRGVGQGNTTQPYSPFTTTLGVLTPGIHTLQATAVTSYGATASSLPVSFTVVDLPTISITAPADQAPFVPSTPISVTANAAAATNGVLSKVQFFETFGGVTTQIGSDIAAPGTYSVTFTPSAVGDYTLTAVATDTLGGVTTSTPVVIHIGNAPSVTLDAPLTGAPFATPATIPMAATATAGTNSIAKVDFYSDGVLVGTDTTSPYTFSYVGAPVGTHTLTAVTTDSIGLTATSNFVIVHVGNPPTVVITSPANNAPFATPATIPIAATATAGSNPITKVDFYSDGVLVGTDTTSPYTFSYVGASVGTHTLTAVVRDSIGLTATSAPITVNVGNRPTITITSPTNGQDFVFPATVPITATVSGGSNSVTRVDFFEGSVLLGSATSSPYTINYANFPVGQHYLVAKVTDSIGLTALSATVKFVMNKKPSVVITSPTERATFLTPVTVPITVAVSGGSNPVSKVDFYSDGLSIGSDSTYPYTFNYANVPAGSHILTAIATDSKGITGTSAPVTIIVNTKPTVTITSPTDQAAFIAPATIPIYATAVAGNHPVTLVEFYANGSLISSDTTAPYTASFANVPIGTYVLTAKVYDSAALTATSAPITVVVNSRPTIVITAPTNRATYIAPVTVPISVTTVAGNHPITKVDFYSDGVLIGTVQAITGTVNYTFNYANVPVGAHNLTAKVTDTYGLYGISTPVTIIVNSKPAITITSPTNGTKFVVPAAIPITTTATAGNHPITQVEFYANGKLIGTDTTAPYAFNYANAPAGTYVLTAKVYDSAGLTATSAPVTVIMVIHQTLYGLVSRNLDGKPVKGITMTFKRQADGLVTTTTSATTTSTGPDGKSENYTISGLEPGGYTATLTYLGTVVAGPVTVTVSGTQPTRNDFSLAALHTFASGQQMFSVPYDYSGSGMSNAEILAADDAKVSISDSLTTYQTASTLTLGQGYWGTFPQWGSYLAARKSGTNESSIHNLAESGWNMIGDPFLNSVAISSINVVTSSGTISIASAANQGIIAPNLATFFAGDSAYRYIPVTGGGSIAPYAGYWVHAFQNCTLSVPPPGN